MSNTDTRTLLERACAKAVDVMLSGDDVATVRHGTDHHVVTIRTVESEEREARTIQRRVEHAERTKADTERELARVTDELAHVRAEGAKALDEATAALEEMTNDLIAVWVVAMNKSVYDAVPNPFSAVDARDAVEALAERVQETKAALVAAESRIAVEANRAAEMEAQANAEGARADAAEQMVVELRGVVDDVIRTHTFMSGVHVSCKHCGGQSAAGGGRAGVEHNDRCLVAKASAALSRTEAVAWNSQRMIEERDAAIARAEKAEADNAVLQQVIQSDATQLRAAIAARDEAVARRDAEVRAHYAAIDDRDEAFTEATAASRRASEAERARDEVGIQLAAAQARIKLLEEGAALLRDLYEDRGEPKWGANGANHYHVPCDVIDIGVGCFLSALDAVPGDALAPRITAALEASGIDASNVKEKA